MTVTDLLQIRTYAEESYLQYTLGRGPGAAALVALPPLCVLGVLILLVGRALARLGSFANRFVVRPSQGVVARRVANSARTPALRLGRQRPGSAVLRPRLACRKGRRQRDAGRPPAWSLPGLAGTLPTRPAKSGAAAMEPHLDRSSRHRRDRHEPHAGLGRPPIANLELDRLGATLCLTLAAPDRSPEWRSSSHTARCRGSTTPPDDRHGRDATLAPLCDFAFVAVLAFTPPRLSRRSRARRTRQPPAIPASRDPPVAAPIVAAWAIAFAIGLGRAGRNQHRHTPRRTPISVVIWALLHTGVDSNLAGVALIVLLVVAAAVSRHRGHLVAAHDQAATVPGVSGGRFYFSGSFGFSPVSTALSASLSWSSRCAPPPTNTLATLPSRSMMTVCGIAAALY